MKVLVVRMLGCWTGWRWVGGIGDGGGGDDGDDAGDDAGGGSSREEVMITMNVVMMKLIVIMRRFFYLRLTDSVCGCGALRQGYLMLILLCSRRSLFFVLLLL